jgi:hypothetical protein
MNYSFFLNIPFVLFPIIKGIRVICKDLNYENISFQKRNTFFKLIDFLLILSSIFLIIVTILRFFVCLNTNWFISKYWILNFEPILTDPTFFSQLQCLVLYFYFSILKFNYNSTIFILCNKSII